MLNVRIAGRLYDDEAARQHGGGSLGAAAGDKACFGVECFRTSFLVITAATVGGALVSLVLVWRTRDFCRGDIYAKFRDGVVVKESLADGGPSAAEQRPSEEGSGGRVNGGQRDD